MKSASRTRSDEVALGLVAAAAALQLFLLPEHLHESSLYGGVFVVITTFQLALAAALWWRPSDRVRRVGRWGSLGIVVLFLGTRLVAPFGAVTPDKVDLPGVLSLLLEIAAVAALAVVVPGPAGGRRRQGFPWLPAAAAAGTFALLDLVASAEIQNLNEPQPSLFRLSIYGGSLGRLTPALTGTLLHHWFLYLPALAGSLTLVVAVLLGAAVGRTVQVSRLPSGTCARFGLLGVLPTSLAAPVCCGPSLLSAVGAGAAGALGALATPLLALSAILLALDLAWLRRFRQQDEPRSRISERPAVPAGA